MAIKVTNYGASNGGGTGDLQRSTGEPKAVEIRTRPVTLRLQPAAPALSAPLSEAVVTTIRLSRTHPASSDQIREHKDAEKTAERVSEKLREGDDRGEGLEAHGEISSSSTRAHLVN